MLGNMIWTHLRSGTVEPEFRVPEHPSKLDPFAAKLLGRLDTKAGKSCRYLPSSALFGALFFQFLTKLDERTSNVNAINLSFSKGSIRIGYALFNVIERNMNA